MRRALATQRCAGAPVVISRRAHGDDRARCRRARARCVGDIVRDACARRETRGDARARGGAR